MKYKKILVVVAVLAMVIGCMAGCGKKDSGSPGESQNNTNANTSTEESKDDYDTSREITVVSREDGSGTRGAFVELMGVEQKNDAGEKVDYTTVEALITNSTSGVMTTVAGNEYAIGYISLGSLDDSVKALKVDGVEATVDNIKAGSYAVSRPFNIATRGEVSEVAQDFIDFILSADGQAVITENKYIEVSEAGAFTTNNASGKVVVAGSSSVTPVMEKLKEAYVAVNPNAEIEIQESDSSTGMSSTIDGICDIGMASRDLKESEIEAGLTGTTIAMDGIAVIVNKACPVDDMTTEQIRNIYVGDALTWEEALK